MRKPEFYLDTSVWGRDGLADPTSQYARLATALSRLVEDGKCRVFGSTELLEEFAGIQIVDPQLLERVVTLFWALVRRNVLLPISETLHFELRKGARLAIKDACLDAATIAEYHRLPQNDSRWSTVHNEVSKRERAHADSDSRLGCEFKGLALANLKEYEDKAPRVLRKSVAAMKVDQVQVESWFKRFLKREHDKLHISGDRKRWPKIVALPCVRAFFSIYIALAKKRHSTDATPKKSDRYDWIHYVHAAYPNCLVTNDRRMRGICSLIEWRPVRVMDLAELGRVIANLETGR